MATAVLRYTGVASIRYGDRLLYKDDTIEVPEAEVAALIRGPFEEEIGKRPKFENPDRSHEEEMIPELDPEGLDQEEPPGEPDDEDAENGAED